MVDPSVLVAALALGVSAVGFFYKIGRDSKNGKNSENAENAMLTQLCQTTETMNKKLDNIAEWQRKAAEIHATHEERIKTLFNEVDRAHKQIGFIEERLNDREVLNKALEKILERME